MSETRYCKQCGKPFTAKRHDHYFDTSACVAAYYRDNPNPDYIHAEKEHIHTYYCEYCGVPFQVNDYAKRGGKRAPKYDSPKCKQAAYRARGFEAQQQAKRRYDAKGQKANTGQTGGNTGTNSGKGHSRTNSGHSRKGGNYWDGYPNKWIAAQSILGAQDGMTKAQLRGIWMQLLKQFHPDVNPAQDATTQTQRINWAYEYLTTP